MKTQTKGRDDVTDAVQRRMKHATKHPMYLKLDRESEKSAFKLLFEASARSEVEKVRWYIDVTCLIFGHA